MTAPHQLTSQTLGWRQLSPPPVYVADSILALSVSGDTVYVGGADEPFFPGVSISTTGGRSWSSANNGVPSTGRIRFIDGSGPRILLVTTSGMYVTNSMGSKWVSGGQGVPASATVTSLARGAGGVVLLGSTAGVFRSTDNGLNWTNSSNGIVIPAGGAVTAITCGSGNICYCGVGDSSSDPSAELASTVQGSLYRSTDGGATWIALPLPSDATFSGGVRVGAVHASASGLFCAVRTRILGVIPVSLLYRTVDNGSTWEPRNTGLADGTSPQGVIRQIAGSGNALFCTAGAGVYRSTDNGANWSLATPVDSGYRTSLAMNGQNVYVGGSKGLLISTDNGTNWRIQMTGAAGATAKEGTLTFTSGASIGSSFVCFPIVERSVPGKFHATTRPVALANGGWTELSMPDSMWSYFWMGYYSILYATATTRTYFLSSPYHNSMWGDTIVFLSYAPTQSTWRLIRLTIPNLQDSELVAGGLLFGVADYLYARVWLNGLRDLFYYSADQGATWTSTDSNHLYEAGEGGYLFGGSVGAVRRATSPTAIPEMFTTGLPAGKPVKVLAARDGALFARVDSSHVVISTDHGQTWSAIDEGLPPGMRILDLVATSSLLALQSADGVWVRARIGSLWRKVDGFQSTTYPYAGGIARVGDSIVVNAAEGASWGSRSGGLYGLVAQGAKQAPAIAGLHDTLTTKGVPVAIPIEIIDDTPDAVYVHAVASDTTLISGLNAQGSGASRLLVVSVAANRTGSAAITLIADDGLSVDTARCVVTVTESGAGVGMSGDMFQMTLMPNPVDDRGDLVLIAPSSGVLRLELFDARGAIVLERSLVVSKGEMVSVPLDLRDIPAGIYRLRAIVGDHASRSIVVCRP